MDFVNKMDNSFGFDDFSMSWAFGLAIAGGGLNLCATVLFTVYNRPVVPVPASSGTTLSLAPVPGSAPVTAPGVAHAGQFPADRVRIGEERNRRHNDRARHGAGKRPGARAGCGFLFGKAIVVAQDRPAHPWQEHPQAEQHDKTAARAKLPPVETDFQQRPGKGYQYGRAIDPVGEGIAGENEKSRRQKSDACNEIKPAAAKDDQPDAAAAQKQADGCKDQCCQN